MKLSKDDLKEIVKECLVEILSEGLNGNKSIVENRSLRSAPTQAHQVSQALAGRSTSTASSQQRTSVYDKMSFIPQKEQVQKVASTQKKFNPLSMVKDITSDPILAGILSETASSGQYLNMDERSSSTQATHEAQVMTSGDAAARKMLLSDPTDLFGESASKWSKLAFADSIRK
jgi:hypothetical protein